jgi:SAM-dependent methyltransferase
MILEHYQDSERAEFIRLFHTVTYRFAEPFAAGKDVLDYGCGSGYGSAMLAASARSVKAVDVAPDAVAYGREHHAAANLEFRVIDTDRPLPFSDASFDSVMSCQVIEHVAAPVTYLQEVVRVLKPGGVLVLATPDRRTRLLPLQRPWNRWHLTEYSERSLVRLLAPHFATIESFTMGGARAVIDPELRRSQWLKWGTLIFTLPILPDAMRVGAIGAIGSLKRRLLPPRKDRPRSGRGLRESDISIGKGLWPSVNLIAVARKG